MSYINSIRWRSFSFYSSNYRKGLLGSRNEVISGVATIAPSLSHARFESFWRHPHRKKNYSLKQNGLSQIGY